MADFVFVTPGDKEELLSPNANYYVRNLVMPSEIKLKLDEARQCLRSEGPGFILDNFDTYYSILHHAENLQIDVVFKAYSDLHKAADDLNNTISFILDDKDSLNDELKAKFVNILKMLLYIYIQFIIYLEQKKKKNQDNIVGKNKNRASKDENFVVDKGKVLNVINNIIQREINLFWDPPVVEHDFTGLLAEICYSFLQNPNIKQEKSTIMDIFGVFGNLIKSFDYGKTFVTRLIQTIRMYEHVVHCVPDGIKMVVDQFNCKGLIHHFVKEATEWQVDETFQDNQGTRCCSIFLTELGALIPDLMIPEIMYLNQYLNYESQPLRNSILNVITEIILKVLTKHDLNDEEKESRDEFIEILIEHTFDVSALVRSKVMQNLAKLQKENAIPLNFQHQILKRIVEHLHDKSAIVRKVAIQYMVTSLEHNPFGANLQLKKCQEELVKKMDLLNNMEASYKKAHLDKIEEMQREWASIEDEMKETIAKNIKNDEEEIDDDEINKDETVEMIRTSLKDKKYEEAFRLCRKLKDHIREWKNFKPLNNDEEVTLYLQILRSFYLNTEKIVDELRTGVGMTPEDIQKIQATETIIKYYENTVEFLQIFDGSLSTMKKLLFTQNISDMHEAINFFIIAYQFKIDNAIEGILEMLKLMQYNEPERKEAVIEAFKSIYLVTDTKNMAEHTTTVVNCLIALLKEITYEDINNFESIISQWTNKGILDNSVIDKCWQYYTGRASCTDDDARAAAELLRMTALGRSTIVTKNIKVITTVAFADKLKDDMKFLASSCRLLAVASSDKIDINSNDPPFKIKYNDETFQTLSMILIDNFFIKPPYYSYAMEAAFDFIFRVSSKPMELAETVLKQINDKLKQTEKTLFLITQFCRLLGYLAIKILGFLDNTVYRELKRRNNIREARKGNKNKNNNKRKSSKLNASSLSTINESNTNESVLMGAEASDTDAEFILNLLENNIVNRHGLGQWATFLTQICHHPEKYSDITLQESAITALMRFMLVSSQFCRDNIKLIFLILKRTTIPDMKCTILIHCSDLLTRFPNIVEPWCPMLYENLKDESVQVRKTTFFALSNLILKDMIRAHSHMSEMAVCLIDNNEEINQMCQTFFRDFAQKDQHLSNTIPDIFSHLVKMDDMDEEKLRFILKFLFDHIDKTKRMENLVDRFCCKYTVGEDLRLNRNITYCLSLITYNDKALRKLHENFPTYKHHLHDAEIYSTFKQILNECSSNKVGKTDLKPIVTDIENCIASVFEYNEDGQPAKPPPVPTKQFKKPRGRPAKKKQTKKQKTSDDEFDETDNNSPKIKKTKRVRAAATKKNQKTSDSDSD